MANVMNMGARSLLRKIINTPAKSSFTRTISTSEKKKDGATINTTLSKDTAIPDFSKPLQNKNWVSFGFDREDETKDLNMMHNFFFLSVTLVFVVGGYFFAYFPDFKERDWAQREGFLELRRREQLGLPLISKDYVDPALIILPSDEELGNTEIII